MFIIKYRGVLEEVWILLVLFRSLTLTMRLYVNSISLISIESIFLICFRSGRLIMRFRLRGEALHRPLVDMRQNC